MILTEYMRYFSEKLHCGNVVNMSYCYNTTESCLSVSMEGRQMLTFTDLPDLVPHFKRREIEIDLLCSQEELKTTTLKFLPMHHHYCYK